MRVEGLQHASDRAVDEAVGLEIPHIFLFDGLQCGGKDLVLVRHLVLSGQGGPPKQAPNQGTYRDNGESGRQRADTSHMVRMYTVALTPSRPDFYNRMRYLRRDDASAAPAVFWT